MQLIPAIDVMGGQVVRLSKGDFSKAEIYPGTPLDWLKRIEDTGLTRVHLVDLEGARTGLPVQATLLRTLAEQTHLSIDIGGGIRHRETVATYLEAGAKWISLGTSILTQPQEVMAWIREFGADAFILGADVNEGYLAMHGWTKNSNFSLKEGLQPFLAQGVQDVICTDISKDGMLMGPAFALYKNCMDLYPTVKWVASGGISSEAHLIQLQQMGLSGAIIGKALYTGALSLSTLAKLQKQWTHAY
jgi:phosphoribosylformimino-5-aminoimidazole carboxamide ribotide isomerase